MKDRTPHLCRNALGTAICASNGIGPRRCTFSPPPAALRRLRQVVESLSRLDALDHLDRNARLGYPDALAQHLGIDRKSSHSPNGKETMSKETLAPPLPPTDARTEAVAERLFGLKWALRKAPPNHPRGMEYRIRMDPRRIPAPSHRSARRRRASGTRERQAPATRTACVSNTGS